MTIHIWHEDSANSISSKIWTFMVEELATKNTAFDIQGMGSSHGLLDGVKLKISNNSINNRDIYLLFLDVVVDNNTTILALSELRSLTHSYKNIFICNIICIEYTLLKFELLEEWIAPKWNEKAYNKFRYLIHLIGILKYYVDNDIGELWKDDEQLIKFTEQVYKGKSISDISIENLSFVLMTNLLNYRKKHFSVTKTELGDCWTCDCCSYNKEKFCNLMNIPLDKHTKAINIFYKSPLCEYVHRASEELQRRGVDIQL